MNNYAIGFFLVFTTFFISCSNNSKIECNSTVDSMNGIYIFIKSKPSSNYKYLGTIDLNWYDHLTRSGQMDIHSTIKSLSSIVSFNDKLESALKQAKEKFPDAQGVIFDDDMSKCEVVLFE